MRIGITCYPTYGGSGVVATELGIELAALGHEVHFISYSQPFRLTGRDEGIFYHEVPVSSYPLFEFPPTTSPSPRAWPKWRSSTTRSAPCPLRHPPLRQRAARPPNARRPRPPPALCHHPPRHRHHPRRPRPQLSAHHSLCHPGKRRRHQHLQLPKDKTFDDFGITRPIEVVTNFVNCDVYTPITDEATARRSTPPLRRARRSHPDAPLQLPPG